MDVVWPAVSTNVVQDRHVRTAKVMQNLLPNNQATVCELEYNDLETHCTEREHIYTRVSLADIKLHVHEKFDVVYAGFVLHDAADDTLPLLNQLRRMARHYVIIGEDLASKSHPTAWHKRNHELRPHAVYRGDREWKCLFDLFRLRLQTRYIIRRAEDPDEQTYRCLYVLKVSAN